eukprot:TRINITY_DN2470_c0_g2_i1.p1 TRINITY_DN2470_c0_g2~~TRINITY_DN2470_c0_g2_i1.p1  ORF type:complete len:834 (+),score=244.92 TRINITY_DN2470_c0_g2_i1:297-2504(+)
MAVDRDEGIVVWSCGTPFDSTNRFVYRCHYTFTPPTIDAVEFSDSAKPALRGGVAVDWHKHLGFVAIHAGKGWRVQSFPLKGCDEHLTQAECAKHTTEGCGWAGSCTRTGSGTDVIQAKTDYNDGAGLTVAAGNLELSYFEPSDKTYIIKKKEDGSGTQTRMQKVTDFWEANQITSVDQYSTGHLVATHDLEPDAKIYLSAVASGKARIYKVDPTDAVDPELTWQLDDAVWYCPGTPGVTPELNKGGAPQPAFALLWNQNDMVYSTGTTIVRRSASAPATAKTLYTAGAGEGTIGPVVWYEDDGAPPPTKAPSVSPSAPPPTAAPAGPPPTKGPQAGSPPTAAPQAPDTPTASPAGGAGAPTKAPAAGAGTTPTSSPAAATSPPSGSGSGGNATATPPPAEDSGSDVMPIVIAAAVLLVVCVGVFIWWYKKSKVKQKDGESEINLQESGSEGHGEGDGPSGTLGQVAKEAPPLSHHDFHKLGTQYKVMAGHHLAQLRHGERMHDPAEDETEFQRLLEEDYELGLQEAAKQAGVDRVSTDILSRLHGDEVDQAMHHWLDVQHDDGGHGAHHQPSTPNGRETAPNGILSTRSAGGRGSRRAQHVTIGQTATSPKVERLHRTIPGHHSPAFRQIGDTTASTTSALDRIQPPHARHRNALDSTSSHDGAAFQQHLENGDHSPPFRRINHTAQASTTSALEGRRSGSMRHHRRGTGSHKQRHTMQPVFASQSPRSVSRPL